MKPPIEEKNLSWNIAGKTFTILDHSELAQIRQFMNLNEVRVNRSGIAYYIEPFGPITVFLTCNDQSDIDEILRNGGFSARFNPLQLEVGSKVYVFPNLSETQANGEKSHGIVYTATALPMHKRWKVARG